MFNRAPSLGRLTLALLLLVGLVGSVLFARCTRTQSTPTALAVIRVAHLTMLNGSHCEWQIAVTPTTGGDTQTWKVPLAKSLDVKLPGGDYAVEQTMLTDDAGPEAIRRFSLRLEPGESYRWRLVTLLSGSSEELHQPARASDNHE